MRHKITRYLVLILAITITSMIVSRLRVSSSGGGQLDDLSDKILAEINQRLNGDVSIKLMNNKTNEDIVSNDNKYDFAKRYPELLACKNDYNKWRPELTAIENSSLFNYSIPSPHELHDIRITRAVIVYFPIEGLANFELELRGLYRSWINMQNFEPPKWRTDLVIFIENNQSLFNNSEFFLNQLNCGFENLRKSPEDKPMCTLVNYLALEKRIFDHADQRNFETPEQFYDYLLKDVDIFKTDGADEFLKFNKAMQKELSRYRYLNSILMAFEG